MKAGRDQSAVSHHTSFAEKPRSKCSQGPGVKDGAEKGKLEIPRGKRSRGEFVTIWASCMGQAVPGLGRFAGRSKGPGGGQRASTGAALAAQGQGSRLFLATSAPLHTRLFSQVKSNSTIPHCPVPFGGFGITPSQSDDCLLSISVTFLANCCRSFVNDSFQFAVFLWS